MKNVRKNAGILKPVQEIRTERQMKNMADVKWIKITTDIFSDEKILLIEQMPDADTILVIWLKMLCMAGRDNNNGIFLMNNRIPYTEEMFATLFRRPLNTVRLAISTFEAFGMIDIIDDTITLVNWEKHQNVDGLEKLKEQNRIRQQRYRERKKMLLTDNVTVTEQGITLNNVTVTEQKRIEEDKKRIDNNILSDSAEPEPPTKKPKPVKHKYGEYKNVLLTDEELQKLKTEYSDYQERIERLSSYVESTGKKYKSHYATIRSWARRDAEKKGRKEIVPSWMNKKPGFNDFMKQEYDMDELERELIGEPKTTGSDPDLKSRADALRERLGTK